MSDATSRSLRSVSNVLVMAPVGLNYSSPSTALSSETQKQLERRDAKDDGLVIESDSWASAGIPVSVAV